MLVVLIQQTLGLQPLVAGDHGVCDPAGDRVDELRVFRHGDHHFGQTHQVGDDRSNSGRKEQTKRTSGYQTDGKKAVEDLCRLFQNLLGLRPATGETTF